MEFDNLEEAKDVSGLFASILKPAFKGNEHLKKGVITGLHFLRDYIVSSNVNNLSMENIDSYDFSEYYGINNEELDILLKALSIDEKEKANIKDWYGGFRLKLGVKQYEKITYKYNLCSVINYLNNQDGFKSYSKINSDLPFINTLMKQKRFRKNIESLVNGEIIYVRHIRDYLERGDFRNSKKIIETDCPSVNSFEDYSEIFYYFYITGYLAIENSYPAFKIPNKELMKEFSLKLLDYYVTVFDIKKEKFLNLVNILEEMLKEKSEKEIHSDIKDFENGLNDLIQGVKLISDSDAEQKGFFEKEDLMNSLLIYIAIQIVHLRFENERYIVEKDERDGRTDFVIAKNSTGIMIELKYNCNTKDDLNQAKKYVESIENRKTKIFICCNITKYKKVSFKTQIQYGQSEISV